MDFNLTESQAAIAELAEQIFTGSSSVERVVAVEATDERFDRELWAELAKAGLLGVTLPEEHGGLGLGMVELALLLEQQGRRVAPVPLWPTITAAMALSELADAELAEPRLRRVVAGECVLTTAITEVGVNDPAHPSVAARHEATGWVLSGEKVAVPAAAVADAVVVSAMTADGPALFLVSLDADGPEVVLSETTNRERHGTLTFTDTLGELVADGVAGLNWLVERTQVALAAITLGCCEEATAMAATHTSTREQFGRPLSTNQGVALRAADCYIDTECIRVAVWQAAWRIDAGRPAADEVTVAKWWAAEIGQRVVHSTQHLHGGTGADVDYPVHRYFLWVKQLENTLGGGSWQLARLGASLAEQAKVAAGVAAGPAS